MCKRNVTFWLRAELSAHRRYSYCKGCNSPLHHPSFSNIGIPFSKVVRRNSQKVQQHHEHVPCLGVYRSVPSETPCRSYDRDIDHDHGTESPQPPYEVYVLHDRKFPEATKLFKDVPTHKHRTV